MDPVTQPKKQLIAKRGRPSLNGENVVKKRSKRKPRVVPTTTTTNIQRPTRVKVKPESDSEQEHDQKDDQESVLETLFPSFSPLGTLNLNNAIPRVDTREYQKLKSTVFGYFRDEMSQDKDQKLINLRPDLAAICKLAGGLDNAQCDRGNIQAIRRKEDGSVEHLYNWYAKDEGKTNTKLLEHEIDDPCQYFDTDKNNNINISTSSSSPSPSTSGMTFSTTLDSPKHKNTDVVDLTQLDNDYSERDIFITKLISKDVSNRKMKTPKRNKNPGDVIQLD